MLVDYLFDGTDKRETNPDNGGKLPHKGEQFRVQVMVAPVHCLETTPR